MGYEPSFSPRPLPALGCDPSFSGLRSLQPQGPPLLSPAHEQLSTIEQRRYAPRLSGLPQPRRQLPLLSDSGDTTLRLGSPFGSASLGWEAELDGPHDARSAMGDERDGPSVSRATWEMAAPAPVTHLLPQPRLSERQSLHTFGLQHRAGALGGSAWSRQALEAEPMLHLHTQQGMALSEDPPASVASPRVSWLQSPSIDVGLRLSADARADESRASPARLQAMGNHAAPPLAPPACLRSCVGGGAPHSPSASRSTSPPQPSGLFGNGGQRGVQPPAFRTRSPPSLQPLCSEPNADLAARTGARGGPFSMAAACTASASEEAPAAGYAADLLSSPGGAEHATVETEVFEEYGSFMPAATSPRLASPCADQREEVDAVPHAPLPTPHDKRTQTTPRLGLTTSCGTQTSPQPAARGA